MVFDFASVDRANPDFVFQTAGDSALIEATRGVDTRVGMTADAPVTETQAAGGGLESPSKTLFDHMLSP